MAPPQPHLWLRILETTDVHANILPYDYFSGREDLRYGLARTATLIRRARQEAPNCVLFDNGDFLQGTPLSDITARPGGGWQGRHPVIDVMNGLNYDAATLGNHEFNFGLDVLCEVLDEAAFPVVCANAVVRMADDPARDDTLLPPGVILKRTVTDSTGHRHRLRIGVIGLLPPQITTWDQFHLRGRLSSRDIIEAAKAHVPRLRRAGADIVVALAHTGIDPAQSYPGMENAALALAGVPGIDAILAGHSHQVFPTPDEEAAPGIDHEAGTLHGVPTVMAGYRGSHLGVLDLCLQRDGGHWRVSAHRAEARAVAPAGQGHPVAPDGTIIRINAAAHAATLAATARPVGHAGRPIHSYLCQVRPDASVAVATAAQRAALARVLADTPHADLPVLSASAPFKAGGRAGPLSYTDIPAGPMTLRNVADLYPFPNTLCGLLLDSSELADWLERAASCFQRITPGIGRQPLWNPGFPGHAFDAIDGLSYRIDLTQPARYDDRGHLVVPGARRITDLCYKGAPLDSGARFVLATNNYRAFGGGPYPLPRPEALIFASHILVRDLIVDHLKTGGTADIEPAADWAFCPMPDGTSAVINSGPGLRQHAQDIAAARLTDLGDSKDGFARFEMPL